MFMVTVVTILVCSFRMFPTNQQRPETEFCPVLRNGRSPADMVSPFIQIPRTQTMGGNPDPLRHFPTEGNSE